VLKYLLRNKMRWNYEKDIKYDEIDKDSIKDNKYLF
jgi:hypothetical protein